MLNKDILKTEFAFVNQLKRATLSISNNVAERFERETDKELIRFLYFSQGSEGEVRNINFLELGAYVSTAEVAILRKDLIAISKQLANYIKYLKKRNSEV